MTPAEAVLADLRAAGLTIRVRPDGLLGLQPEAALTAELRAAALAVKPALIALLTAEHANDDPAPRAAEALANGTAGPIGPCLTCGSYGWWRRDLLEPDGPGPWRCAACSPIPRGAGWVDVAAPGLRSKAARDFLFAAERLRLAEPVTRGTIR